MADAAAKDKAGRGSGRGWVWPVIICALLGGQVLLMATVYYLANTDPTFAVEPDYYQKALDWNQHAAQQQSNARLGWKIDFEIGDADDVLGNREFSCTLINRDGAPLDGAEIELTAFHHARGDKRLRATLEPLGAGRYAAQLRLRRDGLWEFRFDVRRGPDRFTHVAERRLRVTGESP